MTIWRQGTMQSEGRSVMNRRETVRAQEEEMYGRDSIRHNNQINLSESVEESTRNNEALNLGKQRSNLTDKKQEYYPLPQ